ncbi:transcriptional activator of glycolytic enzymes-domain-containing protein [Mucor lusitanicus]
MLQRVIPLVERKLANIEDASRIAYESLSRQIGSIFEKISDNISTGRAPLQINIEWPQGGSDLRPLVSTTALTASTSTSAQESSASLGQPSSTPNNAAVEQNTPSLAPTTYRMSTGVHTVTDLYREWTEGLGGNYSVQYMNANYTGWYSKQKSFYMRRRKIIKACEKYAAVEGWTIDDAVRRAETLRVRNKKSLDYVLCCMQSLRSPACA